MNDFLPIKSPDVINWLRNLPADLPWNARYALLPLAVFADIRERTNQDMSLKEMYEAAAKIPHLDVSCVARGVKWLKFYGFISGVHHSRPSVNSTWHRVGSKKAKPGAMTENNLQESVRAVAKAFGWLHYHTHNSKGSEPGFPDSVLVRGDRIVFAELKSDTGMLTDPQREWLAKLHNVGVETYTWRPADWQNGTIEEALR